MVKSMKLVLCRWDIINGAHDEKSEGDYGKRRASVNHDARRIARMTKLEGWAEQIFEKSVTPYLNNYGLRICSIYLLQQGRGGDQLVHRDYVRPSKIRR